MLLLPAINGLTLVSYLIAFGAIVFLYLHEKRTQR